MEEEKLDQKLIKGGRGNPKGRARASGVKIKPMSQITPMDNDAGNLNNTTEFQDIEKLSDNLNLWMEMTREKYLEWKKEEMSPERYSILEKAITPEAFEELKQEMVQFYDHRIGQFRVADQYDDATQCGARETIRKGTNFF